MNISFSIVLLGLIEILLPTKAFKSQMQLITGAVLIITIISQISIIKIPEYKPINTSDVSVNQLLLENCAITVKNQAESILKEHGITNGKIIVTMDNMCEESIEIKSITIKTTANRAELEIAIEDIERTLNIPVNIGET
ncbi:MAG: hypothetical protein II306_04635 [Clostridia bacterium]|nr:hypothetical protein [Clostridia bacterium]MEE1023465.1 hypothetical protein [Acutalibacteraceae bacterium]